MQLGQTLSRNKISAVNCHTRKEYVTPLCQSYMILQFVKNASYQNDTALPKIGTGPGDSKVDLRYRPESTGGIHHAVMQESNMRLGLCNSCMILQLEKNASYQNDTALPKIGTGPGDSKLTFANGHNPLAAFTMPSCIAGIIHATRHVHLL